MSKLSLGPQNATVQRIRKIAKFRRESLLSKTSYIKESPSPDVVEPIDPYAKFPSVASIDHELARPCDTIELSPSTVSWMDSFLEYKRIPDTQRIFPAWYSAASYYLSSEYLTSRPEAPPRHSPEKEAIGRDVLKCNRFDFKQLALEGITGSWIRLLCPEGGGTCCNAAEAWSWAMILADESTDTSGTWVSEAAADTLLVETILGAMTGGFAEAALWTTDMVAWKCRAMKKPAGFPSDAEAMACRLLNAGLYLSYYSLRHSSLPPDELAAYIRSTRASVLINDLLDYSSDVAHGEANLLAHGYAAGRHDFDLFVYSCFLGDFHELFITAESSLRRPLAAYLYIWATHLGSPRYPQFHDRTVPPRSETPTMRLCRGTSLGDFSWDDVVPLGRWHRSRYTNRPLGHWDMASWQDAVTSVYFTAVGAGHGRLTGDWPAWADRMLHLFVDSVDLGFMVAAFTPVIDGLPSKQLCE
ncbi:hypothetical protein GQ602_001038 [Ophiocordyceps camponoti-floridani]|uniref:Uncharacterized protein n=1 Tax=Ophiocordyceps camponoti-floridani TaxID=2030778 RepID=A0A8H4VH11_9HYPO|nr:hypothetical protein GQ602_001038 [Ophiocordyceps camponoti-floridani]